MFRTSLLLALGIATLALGGTSAPGPAVRLEQAPRFEGGASRLDARTRQRISGVSWHRGCPVGLDDLRLLRVSHWGFDRRAHRGRLVVHRDAAAAMLRTMRAIDVNPIENPYVTDSGYVSPPAGAPYASRSRHRRGMIHRGGPVVAAFAAAGWEWGGNWPWPKDYQHFSATGH